MARSVKRMSGAEVKIRLSNIDQEFADWQQVETESDGEDSSWVYATLRVKDYSGNWWTVPWKTHKSRDGRENGLMFEVYPTVREESIEEVVTVTWRRGS
jgi:hypothetical protein